MPASAYAFVNQLIWVLEGELVFVEGGTRLAVRLQSGYVYGYAFVKLLGLVGLASWAMVKFQ